MSGADYYHCPVCDRKALYDHDESGETPDVEVLHRECLAKLRAELAQARSAIQIADSTTGHRTAQRDQARADVERAHQELRERGEQLAAVEQDRDKLSNELARVEPVLQAAQAWRRWYPHYDSMFAPENTLIAAVDAYRLSECIDETADDIEEDLRAEQPSKQESQRSPETL